MREFEVNRELIDESTISCKGFWRKSSLGRAICALLFCVMFFSFNFYFIYIYMVTVFNQFFIKIIKGKAEFVWSE